MTAYTPLGPSQVTPDTLLALHAAHPQRYPFLLQSTAPGAVGRFDILLGFPCARLRLDARGCLTSDVGDASQGSFLAALDAWWQRERGRLNTDLPFSGGWFLFLGYELACEIEPTLQLPQPLSIAQAVRVPAGIVYRHADGAAWIVDEDGSHEPRIRADLAALTAPPTWTGAILKHPLVEDPEQDYLDAVRTALGYIAAGDIYQANLSRAWRGELVMGVQAYHVYQRLCRTNPGPFAALAILDDLIIVSSSPERLIQVHDGIVVTRPIAGTRPRRHPDGDTATRAELHAHPKERAEHVMLIDLERNDLGRVCEAGSVQVDEFMTLESYAHVHHIVSNVRGRLRAGTTPGALIRAVFPGGTITGCPKVRCMQIIAELERSPRGAYTGSLGILNRDGSMDLNILIRTLEIRDRTLQFRAGAGIVADSLPEYELHETRAKARGLIQALVD